MSDKKTESLDDENTPIVIEVQQMRLAGFANRARGAFRIVKGPRYVEANVFGSWDWIHPKEFDRVMSELISGGHSFEIKTIPTDCPFNEWGPYRRFERRV